MAALQRDRWFVGAGLAAVVLVSWAYLLWMERAMYSMGPECPMHNISAAWTPGYFWMTFTMWAIMMVAMMVPSAAPMVLTFALVNRRRVPNERAVVPAWIFLSGYIAAWTGFSLAATLLQSALHAASLMAPASLKVGPFLGGALLAAAGVYQWLPVKHACLSKCAGPLEFLVAEWREGRAGAWVMGFRHGLFCIGCCAVLMILLFVAGVMNLLWIATLGGLVLVEKLLPARRITVHAFGVLFLIAGIVLTGEAIWKQ
jgi:predicted metal-binding membrane protein